MPRKNLGKLHKIKERVQKKKDGKNVELLSFLSEGMSWIEILEESNYYYLIIVILTNQSLKNELPFTGCQAGPINIFWKHFCSTKTLWYEWKSDGLVMTPPLMLDDRWMLVLNHQQFFRCDSISLQLVLSVSESVSGLPSQIPTLELPYGGQFWVH